MLNKSARSVLLVLVVIGVALSHPHGRHHGNKDNSPPTFEGCNLSVNGRLYQFNPQQNEITNTKDKEGDIVILNMCGNLKSDDVQGLDCAEESSACIVTPTEDGHISYSFSDVPTEFGELRRRCNKGIRHGEPIPDKRELHKKQYYKKDHKDDSDDDDDDDDKHKEHHDFHSERPRRRTQGVYLTYPLTSGAVKGGRFSENTKLTYIVNCDYTAESFNVTDISISEDNLQINVTVYSQLGCPIAEEDDEEVVVPVVAPIFFLITIFGFCCLAICLCRACCRRRRACRNKGYTRVPTQENKNNTELHRISINSTPSVPFVAHAPQHPQMMPYLSPVPSYMNHNLPYFVPLAPMAPVEDLRTQQIQEDERLARELQEQENRQ